MASDLRMFTRYVRSVGFPGPLAWSAGWLAVGPNGAGQLVWPAGQLVWPAGKSVWPVSQPVCSMLWYTEISADFC